MEPVLNVTSKRRERHRDLNKRLIENWELYLFLLPAVVAIIVFSYLPMYGILMAFKDVPLGKTISEGTWVGLKHFRRFFNTNYFTITVKNTVAISLVSNLFTIPLPIVLGLMLHNCVSPKIKKISQTATYIPHLISTVVVISILNLFCNGSTGLINIIRNSLGLSKIAFFGREDMVLPLYVITSIWQTIGYSAVTYLAALSAVDSSLIDAAKIDGASKFQRICNIDIPTIKPTIVTLLILSMGHMFSLGAEKILLMQTPLNLNASETIGTYVYKCGIVNAQYSFSTAVGLFNNLVNFILLLIVNYISRKFSDTYLF